MFTKRAFSFARKMSFTLGFTLIEMGIVLMVLGLAAAGSIALLGPVFDARRAELTTQRMDVIQKALQLYVIQNGCLPCPTNGALASTAANAGSSMSSAGALIVLSSGCVTPATVTCLRTSAVVPWITLGLSEQDITDGWGDRIRYGVAGSVTTTPTCPAIAGTLHLTNGMVRTTGASGCYPAGNLTVDDIDLPVASDTTNAAYVLISSGPDQALALKAKSGVSTADRWGQSSGGQFENSDGDDAYASGLFHANTDASHFDDITRFQSAPNMIQLCGAGACGNPS